MAITKGRITLLENPERIESRNFAFNPNTVDDKKGVNWGEANVLGASHPVVQFGSGTTRIISFEVYMDAIRSGITINGTYDLTEDIKWWRSLIYPTAYLSATAKVSPPKVAFTFGTLWDGVVCVVKKTDVKVTHFSTKLTPMRATIGVDLQEVVTKSAIYSDILYGRGPNSNFPPPGEGFI